MKKPKSFGIIRYNDFVKGQNGITLTALVILIVVLIILASISIGMITGDNGIRS